MTSAAGEELAEIEAVAVRYLTAFTRADAPAVLATYADDGVLMGPGRPASVGKAALAEIYPRVFATTDFDMQYTIQEVAQTSGSWGYVRSATDGVETDKATGTRRQSAYQELFLVRRDDRDGWQIARYCTTKIRPTV